MTQSIRGRIGTTFSAATLAALIGAAATARLDSNQAQTLWLAALCLVLAPSLRTGSPRQQAAIIATLAASGLSIASAAFDADPAWTNPLILILLSVSLAVQAQPAELTWLVPGSAITLLSLLAVTLFVGQPEPSPGNQIAGAALAVLACSSAFRITRPGIPDTLAPAALLIGATVTSIGASLDVSRIWVTSSILLIGSFVVVQTLLHSQPQARFTCHLTLQSSTLAVSTVGLAAAAALLVAASAGDIALEWQITTIVGAGIVGLGCVAWLWQTALSDRTLQFERAKQDSRTDALTGLPNRREIQERLQDEVARSMRYDHALSLLMIDLDDFKSINDRFGHTAGDESLRRAAQAIDASIRSIDRAGRYGGEEFLVILPETAASGAQIVAERIRSSVEQTGHVTVSIGLTSLENQTADPSLLIERADEALYEAKRAGKNRVVLHS